MTVRITGAVVKFLRIDDDGKVMIEFEGTTSDRREIHGAYFESNITVTIDGIHEMHRPRNQCKTFENDYVTCAALTQ